jgi:hypothetical protein
MIRLVFACCVAVAAGALAAAAQDPTKTTAPPPPPPPVVADFATLAETFATNELRADALYVGKTLRVTGTVSRVAVNRDPVLEGGKDAYQVELRAKGGWPTDVDVTFYFPRAARRQLAALTAGTEVILEGTCGRPTTYPADGKGRPKDYVVVAVADCVLAGVVPQTPAAPPAYVLTVPGR